VGDEAARAIGEPGLAPHELRHTAASLAIKAGADVKAVQRMLGHASAAMRLDRYADLDDDDLDDMADRCTRCGQLRADFLRLLANRGIQGWSADTGPGEKTAGQRPVVAVETRGIEPLTPALQNRPWGGLAQWAMTENPT
jgi:hypothetical protein